MLGNLILFSLLIPICAAYIDSVAANVDEGPPKKQEKIVPLVAFECGFRNKYINDLTGKWETDKDRYATCQSGKLDILKYCKKVFPKMNVTNIVEYSHEVAIEQWCREEGTPCQWAHTVRPYQCIDEFRAEALQVPHDCRFSHVNSRESCSDYPHWKEEARKQCTAKRFNDLTMQVRSFAVLEPCGLDLFTGVEFVCCPAIEKDTKTVLSETKENRVNPLKKASKNDDEDDDYEDDYDSDETLDTVPEAQDPYFTKTDTSNEHENFKDAEERMDRKHREKIDKVMKEWSELEARYHEMKLKDPKGAEDFKINMTSRFQKTVASLEEEHKLNKKQLESTHEERVQATLNEKKRQATHDYRQTLAMHVSTPSKNSVLKSLKTYIRSEEKDRIHMLNRYRHLLRVDQAEAAMFKPILLHRLRYIDLRINGTLAMLRDFPDLESQVRPIALAFWSDFRRENTPELSDNAIDGLNSLDGDAKNKRLVDLYREAYEKLHPVAKLDVKAPSTTRKPTTEAVKVLKDATEEEDDEYYEDEEDEELKKKNQLKQPKIKVIDIQVKQEEVKKPDQIIEPPKMVEKSVQTDESDSDSASEEVDEDLVKELRVDIEPIIEEKPSMYRHEKLIQHQEESRVLGAFSAGQIILFVGVLVVVGFVGVLIHNSRNRRHGFIEVDVYTPEEKHVSGMQVNGYENPTYSFFDSKA